MTFPAAPGAPKGRIDSLSQSGPAARSWRRRSLNGDASRKPRLPRGNQITAAYPCPPRELSLRIEPPGTHPAAAPGANTPRHATPDLPCCRNSNPPLQFQTASTSPASRESNMRYEATGNGAPPADAASCASPARALRIIPRAWFPGLWPTPTNASGKSTGSPAPILACSLAGISCSGCRCRSGSQTGAATDGRAKAQRPRQCEEPYEKSKIGGPGRSPLLSGCVSLWI